MSLEDFDRLNFELKDLTKELAYHIVGDPLVLSNLKEYVKISSKYDLLVNITTSGNNISKSHYEALLNKNVRQINFSLNSYNANSHKKSLDEYLEPIIYFVKFAQKYNHQSFINFRLWNLDEQDSAKEFNSKIFDKINEAFDKKIGIEDAYKNRPTNIQIRRKIFFNFAKYFDWPILENKEISKNGFCYGLNSHFGILANGTVVPCCLDKNGVINLGNIKENSLKEILLSQRAKDIFNGFKKNILVEELCQKCGYRTRFDKG